jgi:hypothetical protein
MNPFDNPHAWQPGEREKIEGDIAERQRRIDAEPREVESERRTAPPPEPTAPPPERITRQAASAAMTREWATYIRQQLDRRDRILTGAIADVMAEERDAYEKSVAELRRDNERAGALIEELRKQVGELTARLAQLEAAAAERPVLRSVG